MSAINAISSKLSGKNYRKNGVVYTPPVLSTFVADKLITAWLSDEERRTETPKTISIIDPACGEGELLIASKKALAILNSPLNKIHSNFYGVDLDDNAVTRCKEAVDSIALGDMSMSQMLISNSLLPSVSTPSQSGSEHIKDSFGIKNGFDLLIANPPWGADVSDYEHELSTANYSLKKGQYDVSDLFVEQAMSLVKIGGYFAFILPDSMFGQERKDLRKLLATKTEIKYIARLGEKIFPGINRACAVIVCKNILPSPTNQVLCMRLNNKFRNEIMHGKGSFLAADKMLGHFVEQKRFTVRPDYLFDIDNKEEDSEVIDKITSSSYSIGDYVFSSRGVELSKAGKICRCDSCGFWIPLPTSDNPRCSHCKQPIDKSTAEITSIISKTRFKGSKPLLVGENIRRYSTASRYWISIDSEGINYKDVSVYYEPKILVRKTGVGITATIDYSSALTNQVVYMFRPKPGSETKIKLEFILAIMNSRAMYFYLAKKYGELEWRSHPYLTQTQVLDLPVPDLSTPFAHRIQQKVVGLIQPYLKDQIDLPVNIDAEVERMIARLYGLTKNDYRVVFDSLSNSQELLPVKALSSLSIDDVFGITRLKYGT